MTKRKAARKTPAAAPKPAPPAPTPAPTPPRAPTPPPAPATVRVQVVRPFTGSAPQGAVIEVTETQYLRTLIRRGFLKRVTP